MGFFLNSNHEVRSGWKILSFLVFYVLIALAVLFGLTALIAQFRQDLLEDNLAVLALNLFGLAIGSVVATWLTARFVDHRPLETFGIGMVPHWRRDAIFGTAVAVAMLGVVMAGCYAFGFVHMNWTGGRVAVSTLLLTFATLVVGVVNEELLFRGLPLRVLAEGTGFWPAILIMSSLFGAAHLTNPNASLLGAVNTVVAGVLLSMAYLRTRSLWMPAAIHLVWNLGIGFVFGFALSGIDLASLWTTGTAGSETILGGSYGPEGGLLGTFVFASAAFIVYKHGSKHSIEASAGGGSGRPDRPGEGNPR